MPRISKADSSRASAGPASGRTRRASAVEAMRQAWLSTFSTPRAEEPVDRLVAWGDLCRDPGYIGRWVALEGVRYEDGHPVEGWVIDADDDLATLCARVQRDDGATCAILFCEPTGTAIRRAGIG
jgi:hypothetical protein